MNPRTCAIVHQCGHCLHLTPYRALRNSAATRLELPAPGVAREDPRPGLHLSIVHRQPCVNPFQIARTTAPTGLELPLPGPLRRDPPKPECGIAMAAKAQAGHSRKSRGRALPLGTRCREPGMGSAKVAPAPPLTGGTRRSHMRLPDIVAQLSTTPGETHGRTRSTATAASLPHR